MMIFLIVTFLLYSLLSKEPLYQRSHKKLKIGTYNIWNNMFHWEYRQQEIARLVIILIFLQIQFLTRKKIGTDNRRRL